MQTPSTLLVEVQLQTQLTEGRLSTQLEVRLTKANLFLVYNGLLTVMQLIKRLL